MDCDAFQAELPDLIYGQLDPDAETGVSTHLADCASCAELTAELRAVRGAVTQVPPPPLLQGDRVGIAAWLCLLGAPVLVFGAAFVGVTLPNWLMFAAVLAFLVSFVVLILRMTDSRPPGDGGPDNGAVV